MTEDMQEEHMEALAKLGSDAEGSRLRAQLHSLSLLSDMQVTSSGLYNCWSGNYIGFQMNHSNLFLNTRWLIILPDRHLKRPIRTAD